MRMTLLDRLFLLLTALLAAYQVAIGIEGLAALPTIAYTLAFGVLLLSALLLLILGLEALESPLVATIATLIPLSLSLGLVWQVGSAWRTAYLVFCVIGLLSVIATRLIPIKNRLPALVLAGVHGVAGLVITLLPLSLALQGAASPQFALVSLGGALIGVGGLLLSFLKAGRPVLSQALIFKILPGLLLLATGCFVIGFGA